MRIPPGYEEMIREIAKTAGKYGFYLRDDALKDEIPIFPDSGHEFNVCVHLRRTHDDFKEDAPIAIKENIK
jgi:hypothetical protein